MSSSRARPAAAIAESSVPTAQIPRSASTTPAIVDQPTGRKKSAKAGSATISATARNAKVAIPFASQIALRSHGARTSASRRPCSRSATNARPSPSSAVKTIATQSSPSSARRDEPDGSAKWKTAKIASTKRSIAGSVSRARSSSRRSLRASTAVSPKYLRKCQPPGLQRRDSLRVVRGDEKRPLPAHPCQLAVEQLRAVRVEPGERLVENQQLRLVQQRATESQALKLAPRQR